VPRGLTLKSIGGAHGLARVSRYFLLERSLLAKVGVFALLFELLGLGVPLTVQLLVGTLRAGVWGPPLVLLTAALGLGLLLAGVLRVLQMWAVEIFARRFVERVVGDLAERLHPMSPDERYHKALKFFETSTVDKASLTLLVDVLGLVLQAGSAVVLLALYNAYLLGFSVAVLAATSLVLLVPLPVALRVNLAESGAKYEMAEALLFSGEDKTEALSALGHWQRARSNSFRVVLFQQAALSMIQVVFTIGLLWIGSQLVLQGELTLGQLVAAEMVTALALGSLGKFGKQLPTLYDLVTSFEKLGMIVDGAPSGAHGHGEVHS
jgi:putative ABC transport system ATP-binding protein